MTAPLTDQIAQHQAQLRGCRACPKMQGRPVHGQPVASKILLVGQAPGIKEADLDRPFAWTAGKTLFQWFQQLDIDEQRFRQRVYMAAVCRCYPGKKPNQHGDRVPDREEIQRCRQWLETEQVLLKPQLIIPIGKLAISQFLECTRLAELIGQQHTQQGEHGHYDLIPLPHPSGASTWHRTEPGKSLLQQALQRLAKHPTWQATFSQ